MSISSYAKVQQNTETPRNMEYRALGLSIRKLLEGQALGGVSRIDAICFNQRLWNAFQADLCLPENGLPDAVKGGLISLSIWVQKYCSKAMLDDSDLNPLIEVNRQVMEGLSPQSSSMMPQTMTATEMKTAP